MPEYHYQDSYDDVNKNKDKSLISTYPYLMMNNISIYYNWQTSIFLVKNWKVYYTNATGNYTKADIIYLQNNEKP